MTRRRPANAARRRRTGTVAGRSITGGLLPHEIFAGFALVGILAAQSKDPDAAWLRRRSFRIGCDFAEEAARLRRKQRR